MQQPLWQQAASFAARAHQGQLRKDGRTPYVAHVFRVALTVRDLFGCGDQFALAAALLHDTIEDTTTDYDDIEKSFGNMVADIVASLTKDMTFPESRREELYDLRLTSADWRARLIKLADTYDNLSDLSTRPDQSPEARQKLLDRCRRAIDLARVDADAHEREPIRKGIAHVERLMKLVEGG